MVAAQGKRPWVFLFRFPLNALSGVRLGRGREALSLGITLPSQYFRYLRFLVGVGVVGVGVRLAMQLAMNASRSPRCQNVALARMACVEQ